MKRAKKLLLLIAVLAIIIAGYAIVSRFTAEEAAEEDTGGSVTIASLGRDSVKRLEWVYAGQTVVLEKSAGKWKYAGDDRFPLDQSIVDTMLTALEEVKASRSITDAEALSEYGLDEPECIIEVMTSDGSGRRFAIGDMNEVTDEYYVQTDSDSAIYLVDETLRTSFAYSLMDLVRKEDIPYMSRIDTLTVQTQDGSDKIVYLQSSEGITYTDVYKWFYEVEGEGGKGYSPLSTEKVIRLHDKLRGLKWNSCADYSAERGELEEYGLTEPRASVTAEFSISSDETDKVLSKFELLIGNDADDGESYAMLKGSDMVYLIDSEIADALLAVDYESLRTDDVCLMDWNTVDSMDVEVDGSKLTIDFSRGEEGLKYMINGSEADTEKVKELLAAINDLDAVDEIENAAGTEAEITVVFRRNTKYFANMTLKLSRYDSSHYLVSFIGQSRLLVANSDVASLKQAFNAIKQ